jgi:hypothetical protein
LEAIVHVGPPGEGAAEIPEDRRALLRHGEHLLEQLLDVEHFVGEEP